MLFVEQIAHERVVLCLRHCIDVSRVWNEWLILLIILPLLGRKIFTQPESYCPTNYCLNTRVRLSPNGWDPWSKRLLKGVALLLCVYWSQWTTSTRFIRRILLLLSINTQLQVLVLIMVPELGTVSPPSVPNWLISLLKPRAQLCMEVASDCDDHWPRVDLYIRVRVSKVQGRQCSRSRYWVLV